MTNSKPKVLAFMTLPPPLHGANVINSQVAASPLLKKNFELKILPISYNDSTKTVGQWKLKKLFKMISLFFQLGKALWIFKPDLIYFPLMLHGKGFYRDAFYVLLMRSFGQTLIFPMHALGIERATRNFFARMIYRLVFKKSYIIHHSRRLFSDLDRIVDGVQKTYAIFHGVPNEPPLKPNRQPGPILCFINVSHFYPLKGQRTLLKAAKRLVQNNQTRFCIQLIGEVLDRAYYQELQDFVTEHHLEKQVSFRGPLFGKERDWALANADVFVFPSNFDVFGLVVIEAMKQKLPVIATEMGTMPEILVDDCGWLFSPENEEQLAQHMTRLIENPVLVQTMGEKARQVFQNKFTFEDFEKSTQGVFLDILQLTGKSRL